MQFHAESAIFKCVRPLLSRRAWPYLALLAEVLIFFRNVVFNPSTYVIPWDFQYWAFNETGFLARALREGHFPLWDPYTYCGLPYFANMQGQLFYPPTLITALAANLAGPDHLMQVMALELVGHVFLAGVFTFWLLEALECSRLAALIGSTAFQLGCYFASQTQHFGAILGAIWLPLSCLALIRLANRFAPKWIMILVATLALPLLAGYPSTVFSAYFCTAALAVALVLCRNAPARLLIQFGLAAIGGLALSAIQLLPTLQNAAVSVSKYRGDWRHGGGLRLEALPSLVWPNYHHVLDLRGYDLPYNFTFLYLYCGLVPLALAIFALVRKRHSHGIAFLLLLLASAFVAFGDSTPPGALLQPYLLDAVHDAVYPEFTMVGLSLAVAVLAGMGANRLSRRPELLLALAVLTAVDLTYFGSGRPMNTRALADEAGVTTHHFDGSPELLDTVRRLVNAAAPPSRIDTYQDSMSWAIMAPTTEVPTSNGNDPMALISYMKVRLLTTGGERWGRYYELNRLDSPILKLLNVKYVLSREPISGVANLRFVQAVPGHLIYENQSVLPRFFLVNRIRSVSGTDEGVQKMSAADYDPAALALVQGMPEREYPPQGQSSVRCVRYELNEVELETVSDEPRFLVTSEAAYPGWRALIDGEEARIVTTNVAFRGLEIPPGRHRVIFRFRPQILWWSALISASALLAALAVVFATARRPSIKERDRFTLECEDRTLPV